MGGFVQDIRLAFRVLLANRGFAAATLLTVAVGVGGTAAGEIGVRAALGATPGHLVVMVLKQGMTVAVMGLVIGLGGSIVASRAMAGVLFEVEALDGAAFVIPSAIVLVVAAVSCWVPGRRAAAIAPAEVLVPE